MWCSVLSCGAVSCRHSWGSFVHSRALVQLNRALLWSHGALLWIRRVPENRPVGSGRRQSLGDVQKSKPGTPLSDGR